jgi:outer membrane protein OmpA-like peptidoglycan-associated protein
MAVLRRVVVASVLIAMVSCSSVNPFTREQTVSKTTKGALVGGAVGAAAGALSGDDRRERMRRALLGAGIGALAGGAVGNYMDRQEAALRERLVRSGVGVTRMENEIQLVMPGNVTFEWDRADIRPDFYETLASVALVLREYDRTLVEISGHTDSTGDAMYNQGLSERRAEAVRRYLAAQQIREVRLVARGFGARAPIASNDSAEGRQLNRRVEIRLVPLTE